MRKLIGLVLLVASIFILFFGYGRPADENTLGVIAAKEGFVMIEIQYEKNFLETQSTGIFLVCNEEGKLIIVNVTYSGGGSQVTKTVLQEVTCKNPQKS